MTNTVDFIYNGVVEVKGQADTYVGEFIYKGVHFRFTTTSGSSLSHLVNDKSKESLTDAVNHLTIFRLEGGVVTYLVCNEKFAGELALQICKGF